MTLQQCYRQWLYLPGQRNAVQVSSAIDAVAAGEVGVVATGGDGVVVFLLPAVDAWPQIYRFRPSQPGIVQPACHEHVHPSIPGMAIGAEVHGNTICRQEGTALYACGVDHRPQIHRCAPFVAFLQEAHIDVHVAVCVVLLNGQQDYVLIYVHVVAGELILVVHALDAQCFRRSPSVAPAGADADTLAAQSVVFISQHQAITIGRNGNHVVVELIVERVADIGCLTPQVARHEGGIEYLIGQILPAGIGLLFPGKVQGSSIRRNNRQPILKATVDGGAQVLRVAGLFQVCHGIDGRLNRFAGVSNSDGIDLIHTGHCVGLDLQTQALHLIVGTVDELPEDATGHHHGRGISVLIHRMGSAACVVQDDLEDRARIQVLHYGNLLHLHGTLKSHPYMVEAIILLTCWRPCYLTGAVVGWNHIRTTQHLAGAVGGGAILRTVLDESGCPLDVLRRNTYTVAGKQKNQRFGHKS